MPAFHPDVEKACQLLTELLDADDVLRMSYGLEPAPKSVATDERRLDARWAGGTVWGATPVKMAHDGAWMLQVVSEYQARSVVVLAGADTPSPYAHQGAARSGLEIMARALWVGDPEISAERRVRRWQSERLHSLAESGKLGLPGPDPKRATALLTEGRAVGFSVRKDKKGRPRPFYEDRPAATSLVSQLMLDDDESGIGATLYRYYSATNHGTVYALMQNLERQGVTDYAVVKVTALELIQALASVAYGTVNLMRKLIALYGWDAPQWQTQASDVVTSLRVILQKFGTT